ncbi:MAG: 50S ribosomal protein L11 methyltransferase [Bacteroidia bacterium]|nr:50S ribosomal protein L11 methyltransferase [Bacteroidia bacterium]
MKKTSTDVQFTPYEISFCLYDIERTSLWKQAIEDVVKKGDIVVDAGAGTGILGVFAALDEAKHVYSIELQPRFCRLIKNLADKNGVGNKLTVINADASTVEIPGKIDVVICELLCTGQFFEPEVQVINHLRKFFKPTTRIIPNKIESHIQLLDAHEIIYGVRIDTDSRSILMADDEPVSTTELYNVIDLTKPVKPYVDTVVTVRARKTRIADAVVITSRANLTDSIVTKQTKFLYNPEIIYLKKPVNLIKGKLYEVHIKYPYGCDTLDAEIVIRPKK